MGRLIKLSRAHLALGSLLFWLLIMSAAFVATRRILVEAGAIGLAAVGILVLVVGMLLNQGVVAPLRRLRHALDRVESGDYAVRLPEQGTRELREVAAGFNSMAEILGEQWARLQGLAATDGLTGLANHRQFQEVLHAEIERAGRRGEPMSLISVDLDDFKQINDTHGHPYGDEVLRAVAAKLRGVIRAGDLVARVGGEEFALVLPGADPEGAYDVAERARAAIGSVPVRGSELSCSAGIASYPVDADDGSTLLQLTDGALYWAKRAGKRQTRRYDPDKVVLEWTDQHRAEIVDLLERPGSVQTAFQPVVELDTGRPIGYEALARFPSWPQRGPRSWLLQARGCGLGPELEAKALATALAHRDRPAGTHLALNISPAAIGTRPIQDLLPHDLDGLIIEIAEDELAAEDDSLIAILSELRARGARIAVDDAGASYTSLTHVTRMQPEIVKLDRELTADMQSDAAKIALAESLVRFAHRIGATVCAAGVESLDELTTLTELGVAWGQGYALGRPGDPWPQIAADAQAACVAAKTA